MPNLHHIAKLAAIGRARIIHVDHARAACMVRLAPPRGGSRGWPSNVVAIRSVPYNVAAAMPGLLNPARMGR